jgi:hypothetical protein
MARGLLILSLIVLVLYLPLTGCKNKQNKQTEQTISELAQKEEELKNIGVPSFITQEQAKMEKEETNVPTPELQIAKKEVKPQEVKPQETMSQEVIPQEVTPQKEIKTETPTFKKQTTHEEIISKEATPQEVKPQETMSQETMSHIEKSPKSEVKPLSESIPKETKPQVVEKKEVKEKVKEVKKISKYPTKSYTKVYFSYRNGYDYVSKDKPCKITTVLFPNKDVWYADYNIYAVPLSKAKVYKKYLIEKYLIGMYLIGIGRNISIVDRRSQLTVYWTGINIAKKPLPKGKYIIVSSTHLKNMKKKVIGKIIKVLGTEKPLVVVLK